MACITASLLVLHKMNPVAHSCLLHRLPSILRFAPSHSKVLCLFTGINHGEQPSKSRGCVIKTVPSPLERMSADVCLKKSLGSHMIQTLNISSWSTVSIAIPNVATVTTHMLLCSSQSRVGTASHGVFSAEADEAWWIDATRLGRCGRLLPWEG